MKRSALWRRPIVKPASIARRTLMVALLTGTSVASTGCSTGGFSLASMNPFARSAATPELGPNGSLDQAIASAGSSSEGNIQTVSAKTKDAFGKTTNAIAGVFRREDSKKESTEQVDSADPLRLDNMPEKVDPGVFVANGQLWESTGDFNKAMESYTKAIEQNSDHPPALTSLARLQFRQGNLSEAATYFGRAIAQKPNDAGLHNDLGLTLSKLGNQPDAIKSLEKALSIQPGTSRYANNLASVRYEAGDPSAALSVLMQNNKPAVAHFNMAYLYFKSGKKDQAKGHLAEAMKYEPQSQSDPATGRAVQRSRDMLAQLGGTLGPVAQVAPQAKIAGGNVPGAPKYSSTNFGTPKYSAPIQQTSQAGTPANSVSTAASNAPATLVTNAPGQSVAKQAAMASVAPATNGVSSAASEASDVPATPTVPNAAPSTSIPKPKWNSWNRKATTTPQVPNPNTPIRPATTPSTQATQATSTPAPATGFSLPESL